MVCGRMRATLVILSACAVGSLVIANTGVAQASSGYKFTDAYGTMWWDPGLDHFMASTTNNTPLTGELPVNSTEGYTLGTWVLPNGKCMAFNNDGNDSGTPEALQVGYIDEATCSPTAESMQWYVTYISPGVYSFTNEYATLNYSPSCPNNYDISYLGANDGSNSELSMNCPDKAGNPSAGETWST